MSISRLNIISYCLSIVALMLISSCATYNQQVSGYYNNLQQGDFDRAGKELEKSKLLKKNRNRLLYLLESGKLAHLQGDWKRSNDLLNEADQLMESARTSAKDVALGNLLNPMMQTYKAEDFEKYLVHYYKTLNYLQLGERDEAMVEARRITLRTYTQEDKVGNKKKYAEDAFSLILQGMIYESASDLNNAFISYRNAVDVYLENNGTYYGVKMPPQLVQDLLRLADANGFTDELARYQTLLNVTYNKKPQPEGGEMIVFWENGSAPVKQQEDIWFSLFKDGGGNFMFTDAAGLYQVPFDRGIGYNEDNIKLGDLRSFRVALPKYSAQPLRYSRADIVVDGSVYALAPAENVNTLAFATLKERQLKDLSLTLTRLAIKKLAEAAVRPADIKEDKNKSEEEKKKEKKQHNQREAIALGLQLFNFASEKADTRNWQSLPHTIFYTRVPLQKKETTLSLHFDGGSSSNININVTGTGSMQFKNVCTFN